ncbi:hypothetical protein HS088_TW07G00532 [Tripterygium wilfordii]|uniref:Uncharacterized protein n=1 Tax=Tripterygium wilfordii TaxID=458696 RepID=A0A7J7DF70_TRIWF|nr:hypothetical protein HS088_TW07G00532 [Tripterygium wilfordii]
MATQYHPLCINSSPLPTKSKHIYKTRPFIVGLYSNNSISGRKLRAGASPAGSSAAEALASGGVETFLFESNTPTTAKPCGDFSIPLCMLYEFSIPLHLIDRHATRIKIISPSISSPKRTSLTSSSPSSAVRY